MKIEIIGTTPIMVIKALLLSKFHDVTVEGSNKFVVHGVLINIKRGVS